MLVGREPELARLAELLGSTRVVSIVGPPGVGKTALALAAAGPSAVVVRLEGVTDVAEVAGKVAQALGVPLRGRTSIDAVLAGQGALVLALDGIDRVALALAPEVARWSARAPSLAILATGRSALGAAGEALLPLAPLAVEHAVQLFLVHATAAGFRPRRTPEEAALLAQLVEQLDRLPLALELAGARAGALSPRQIAERTRGSLELLSRVEEGRIVSLGAALSLSVELLSELERGVLEAAAIFAGPFSVDSLEAVLKAEGVEAGRVVDALVGLSARSVVQRLELDDDEVVRFRLLESIRAYVRARPSAADKEAARRARADEHLVLEVERLVLALETGDEARAATALTYLFDDLAWLVRRLARARDELAARAGIALATFAVPRGLASLPLVSEAAAAARRTGDSRLAARALHALARAQNRAGLVAEPRAALDEALARAEPLADAALTGRLLVERARFGLEHGELDGAAADLDAARRQLAQVDEPFLDGLADNERGRIYEARGALEEAGRAFSSARARFRAAGSVRLGAIATLNLAVTRYAEGRLEEARVLFEQALAGHRAARDPAAQADNLLNMGSLHLTAGRLDEAERSLLRALAEERRLGNRRFEGLALGNLAMVAHERGDLELARARYQGALGVFREIDDRRFEAVFLPFSAAALASAGQAREARADFERARRAFDALGDTGSLDVLELLETVAISEREEREARLARAARRLACAGSASRAGELPVAERIVRATLERSAGAPLPALPPSAEVAPGTAALAVGADGRWFSLAGAPRVELTSRATLRRVLSALVEQRLTSPGVGLDQAALFDRAWRGDKASYGAARDRVYAAIRALRRAGLEPVLLRQDDGYLLDPRVRVERAP